VASVARSIFHCSHLACTISALILTKVANYANSGLDIQAEVSPVPHQLYEMDPAAKNLTIDDAECIVACTH